MGACWTDGSHAGKLAAHNKQDNEEKLYTCPKAGEMFSMIIASRWIKGENKLFYTKRGVGTLQQGSILQLRRQRAD